MSSFSVSAAAHRRRPGKRGVRGVWPQGRTLTLEPGKPVSGTMVANAAAQEGPSPETVPLEEKEREETDEAVVAVKAMQAKKMPPAPPQNLGCLRRQS